ncbi:hypothetical protein TU51_05930 [Bacillus cytotoxicus]|nr:hypothetical protein CG482_006180 [Bacillus cytotoxicus]AWC36074.1 hypothetical protein CG481_006190 [Bacillus cytotoxicus]AWC60321.1 hypothetical protein CG474_006255 [Bacillus cytotoxicus]KMT50532.1 hypothetical protein TU51_05930 [Bacillus cytotoxicus]
MKGLSQKLLSMTNPPQRKCTFSVGGCYFFDFLPQTSCFFRLFEEVVAYGNQFVLMPSLASETKS